MDIILGIPGIGEVTIRVMVGEDITLDMVGEGITLVMDIRPIGMEEPP